MIRVFIGYDPREAVAFGVLAHSIHRRASRPVSIAPVMLWTAGLLSLGATVLTLLLALGAGLVMRSLTGVGLDQALLALAPGGLAPPHPDPFGREARVYLLPPTAGDAVPPHTA